MTANNREPLAPMLGMPVTLGFLTPSVRTLTPERARDWLRRSYRRWSALASQGYHRGVPARMRKAASLVDIDTTQMVEACALALDTGKAIRLEHSSESTLEPERVALRRLEALRAIAELEARSCEGSWRRSDEERFDTGMRGVVQRSIRAQERRLARRQRHAA